MPGVVASGWGAVADAQDEAGRGGSGAAAEEEEEVLVLLAAVVCCWGETPFCELKALRKRAIDEEDEDSGATVVFLEFAGLGDEGPAVGEVGAGASRDSAAAESREAVLLSCSG